MAKRNDKRVRLVEAADALFHQKGFNMTTLANIADLAKVPLGNVYYYFKSKDSIAMAVISGRLRQLQDKFAEWDSTLSNPEQRLEAFIKDVAATQEDTAKFGDAMGSLCQELGKQGGEIASAAAELMQGIISWVEKQYSELNSNNPKDAADSLISSLQGISLLTVTFKDTALMQRQANMLLSGIVA